MAKYFAKEDLPHFVSTRDTRDRLDMVKASTELGEHFMADRIIYHPGDDCAKHYHEGAYHLFYMLYGEGWVEIDYERYRMKPGSTIVIAPEEVHQFGNDKDENFAFLEYWAPKPSGSVQIVPDDI
jgi:quercetin dioxygenase-like cupin family protein